MPHMLNTAVGTMHAAANMALNMYWGLSHGAYNAIHAARLARSRRRPSCRSSSAGEWSGTMNLTEPHCGTDLGLLRTRAEPQADGSYRVTGQKIFISAGEHDLTENIVHLVLARIPGAPAGVKGISLFIVPKFLVDAGRQRSARATPSPVGKIEEKMGIHGNATCVMNYDGATGWLVGEPHKGLRAMFTMMNEARLGGRRAGPRAGGRRLPGRGGLRPRPAAGPGRDRGGEPGRAGRSADRPSRRAARADGPEGLRRGRAGLRCSGPAT